MILFRTRHRDGRWLMAVTASRDRARSDTPLVHIIDDDDAVRDLLALLLDAAGIVVRTYRSRQPSSWRSRAASFDGCVLTEMGMPDLGRSGPATPADRPRRRTLPVITATGRIRADRGSGIEGRRHGFPGKAVRRRASDRRCACRPYRQPRGAAPGRRHQPHRHLHRQPNEAGTRGAGPADRRQTEQDDRLRPGVPAGASSRSIAPG